MARVRTFHSGLALGVLIFSTTLAGQSHQEVLEYLSPKPGAQFVSRASHIIMRFKNREITQNLSLTVRGAVSGEHDGVLTHSDDNRTLLFKPARVFSPGETVTVSIRLNGALATTFDFEISKQIKPRKPPEGVHHEAAQYVPVSQHMPDNLKYLEDNIPVTDYKLPADFPRIAVTHTDNPAPGYIFLSNFSAGNSDPLNTSYLLILDNQAEPVFFRRLSSIGVDFKMQPNGLLTYYAVGQGFYALDSTYTQVGEFKAGNGYMIDSHDLQLLDNGHALVMIYDSQTMDMSQIIAGGDTAATVTGLIIQEIDAEKNVVFQWRSWDHFQITDATHTDFTSDRIDYVHGNAIEGADGNLLISCRSMDEITKIDRHTGEIIWRLGGKNNQFTFVNDPDMFSYQHDIRRLPNGNITLFDNGNFHEPQHSRAVEYELDEENMTATLVWQYRHSPDYYSAFMGNVQRLAGSNTMIGWGGTNPNVTEVRPDGTKAFELTFVPDGIWSYRSFRFQWNGIAAAPYLWADTSGQELNLHFTKFGDEDVRSYRLYRGDSPDGFTVVDSTRTNSFTPANLTEGSTYFFRVTAINNDLQESPFSNDIMYTAPLSTALNFPKRPLPETYLLSQNYPNPFNAGTTISYGIPIDSQVSIKIFNLRGQEVATLMNESQTAGFGSVHWAGTDNNGRAVSSGLYIYLFKAGAFEQSGKMILMR